MANKNSTIKFLTITQEKEQADKIAHQLQLPKQQTYEALFDLGIRTLQTAFFKGNPIEIKHDINSSCKRIEMNRSKKSS